MPQTTTQLEREIMADPSISNWLKTQLTASRNRDPIDALNDAELLVTLLNGRLDALAQCHQSSKESL